VYYYRYLAKNHTLDYIHYWLRFLLNIIYSKINSALPDAPVLPLLSLIKKTKKAIRYRMEDNDS